MDREIADRETLSAETIDDAGGLRACYAEPSERVRRKCLPRLDKHCRAFIARSPFLCLGTADADGLDVSPRGDAPGFVLVLSDNLILVPDRPGNNRLDSLGNVLARPQVGLLFMIPGMDETLRVNGSARITTDASLLAASEVNGKRPKSGLLIEVREAYLHCGKAMIRSKLWKDDYKIDRKTLPTLGQMINDQVPDGSTVEEVDARINAAYEKTLY
jgi:PPOX class probable FMN-dependent enzyme